MDVVGYSKLMGADEAGTLARLNALRRDLIDPTVAKHSGRTFKLIGDGSLVEFASAADAVSCALEIQDLIGKNNEDPFFEKKIELRMGVNIGDVLVDGDDIYGDGVNIAARIEALAAPGGVFLSRSAADAVRGKLPVRLENRGRRSVKNIAQPVEVLLVVWDERSASQSSLLDPEPLDEQTLPPWPPDWDRDRAPYRGLRPLESVDAAIFFGRDGPIAEAMERLKDLSLSTDKRILVILGASGAGKSSFLRAGLLPRLARVPGGFLPLPAIRPEHSALFGENGLLGVLETALPQRTRAEIRAAIRGGAVQLAPMLTEIGAMRSPSHGFFANSGARPTVILAIDQAEELFRAEGSEQAEALLTLVRDLAQGREQQVITIFAIRSDSYDALQRAGPLEGLAQSALPLLPLPRRAYKDVIEGPARRFAYAGGKLTIERQLTERLLEDLEKGGGDALPLLAFTLEQLFLEYHRSGALRLADYEEFGELRGAIDAAVGRAFRRADADPRIPKDRRAREALLRRGLIPWLAGIDPDTKSPRRNIARRSDIPEEARPRIDLLVEERLLSTDTHMIDEDETRTVTRVATIEPAHEALLRQWGLLEGWIAEDLGLLATLEGIRRAARDWEANGGADAWLAHQGLRLAEARTLDARPDLAAQLDGRDRAYLARCNAREVAAVAEREQARANELARAKAEAERAQAEADRSTAQARYSRQLTRLIAAAAALGLVAKREATRAEESYRIARDAADSLVVDIAQGLRAVEGMPTASVRRILDTAKGVIERLVAAAPDDPELGRSRVLMQRQFAVNYAVIGDLDQALDFGEASVAGARQILAARPNKDSMITLAYSRLQVGRVDELRGDAGGARAAATEALDLASKVASAGKDEIAAGQINLLELCGLVGARVIDLDGVYDPCRPNDRLLLGMKGSISEFELGVLRARMCDAARSKARRGELRISVPVGYVWDREIGLGLDPDMRLQEAVRLIFARFRELGSARQVLLSLAADQLHFPRPSDGRRMIVFDWTPIRYRNVISVLKNPFYAGAYIYGKSEHRTAIVNGRAQKTYGHGKPFEEWEVVLKDHHEGYIDWAEFERNQKQLAANAYGRVGEVKSGRGGQALVGLLRCARCGRRLKVAYYGRKGRAYRCDNPNLMLAAARCLTFAVRASIWSLPVSFCARSSRSRSRPP